MELQQPRKPAPNVCVMNPFDCRMWAGHGRLQELITEDSCKEEIESFLQHGQKQAVLGRPVRGDSRYRVELIYGARRLFVAQHLNAGLLVEVREMDDREAFIEMDVENRLRKDLSPYERGMAYKDWLRHGFFQSQKDLATTLGVSTAHVSRLLRFAELPAVVMRAFGSQTSVREAWAIALADRCKDPQVRAKMTVVARALENGAEQRDPGDTFRLLSDCEDSRRRSRVADKDVVIRSAAGTPLFRICYRNVAVHIVLPRERVPSDALERLTQLVKEFMSKAAGEGTAVATRSCGAGTVAGGGRAMVLVRGGIRDDRGGGALRVTASL